MAGPSLHFDGFEIDTNAFELRHGGSPVQIEPQVLELLVYLARNRGRLITRDELIENIWGGRIVSDAALSSRIKSARQAIGDDGSAQRLIRTVHGRGFRFVGEIREAGEAQAAPPQQQEEALGGFPSATALSDAPALAPSTIMPAPPPSDSAGGSIEAAVARVMDRPAIAVLPFVNLSSEPGHDYIVDGMTDDIIAALSAWRWFPVLSRNAVYFRNDATTPPAERGRQLGARYVLSGTVQPVGTRMKIRPSLTDADAGLVIWGTSIVREIDELFSLQDELAKEIVCALEPELQSAEHQRIIRMPPGSLSAWDLAMQAAWHANRMTAEDYQTAEALAVRAAELDPNWSYPHTLISFVKFQQVMLLGNRVDLRRALSETLAAAHIALDIDDRAWIAHALSGIGELWTNVNHDRALSHLQKALELNPSANWTYHFHGCVTGFSGQLADAQASGQRTFRIDPHYSYTAVVKADLALWAMLDERLDDAASLINESLSWRPDYGRATQRLAAIEGLRGNRERARAAAAQLPKLGMPIDRSYFESTYPFLHQAHRDTFVKGLRIAGINI